MVINIRKLKINCSMNSEMKIILLLRERMRWRNWEHMMSEGRCGQEDRQYQEREDAIKSRWEVEREAADCSGALVPTVYARHRPY